MPIDDRTTNRSYKLPNAGNMLSEDVQRLRDALTAIDADVFARYTKAETDQKLADLINGAPNALDTLNELAAAMGNDPNFAATITNALANKPGFADIWTRTQADARYVQGVTQTENVFTGTGSQTTFALTQTPPTRESLLVTVDGVVQPTTAYNLSGSALILSEAPASGANIRVLMLGVAGPVQSASTLSFMQAGTGVVTRTVQNKLREVVSVKDFGAVGDGSTDDTTAIQLAINYAQTILSTVLFPPGEYKISNTLNINTAPIHVLGEVNGVWQQGSILPAVTLTWTGGAAPMFSIGVSNVSFEGLAAQNKGTATDFASITFGTRYRFHRCSWLPGSGTTPFSRSVIYAPDSFVGYSTFSSCQAGAVASKFLFINGNGTAAQTPIRFTDRCIFESNEQQPMTVVYVKGSILDALIIDNCTFNQQGLQLTVVDTTDTPASIAISVLIFQNNEWDGSVFAGSSSTDRIMRLTNVATALIDGNHLQGGGIATFGIVAVNSKITSLRGNWVERFVTALVDADANSFVNAGQTACNLSNTLQLASSTSRGHVVVTWTSNTLINPQLGDPSRETVFIINVTGTTAWFFGWNVGSFQGWAAPGQVITVLIRNTSGGAMASPSYGANTKVVGASFPLPANGFSRSITFFFDGTNFIELRRGAADVPN